MTGDRAPARLQVDDRAGAGAQRARRSARRTLRRPLRARDTELMAAGLRALGAHVSTVDDERWLVAAAPAARARRTSTSGWPARSCASCRRWPALADGPVTFDGDPRARQPPARPAARGAARARACAIDGAPARRPAADRARHRAGRAAARSVIDASASSQFVSGLLLAAPRFDQGIVVRHVGPPVPSRAAPADDRADAARRRRRRSTTPPRTSGRSSRAGCAGRGWDIEPDLSGAAPFLAAALVTGGAVTVPDWPRSTTQPVDQLRELLSRMGGAGRPSAADGLTVRGTGAVRGLDADLSDVSELTPVLAALAALADSPSRLRGVAHIRGHETDRLAALARELGRLGADVDRVAGRAGDPAPAAARRPSSRPTPTTGWRTPPRCSAWPCRASSSPTWRVPPRPCRSSRHYGQRWCRRLATGEVS